MQVCWFEPLCIAHKRQENLNQNCKTDTFSSQYFVLPKMTPEGYRVSVFRLQSPDLSAADIDLRLNAIKVLSSYDTRFQEENYWAGDVIIVDFENFSLKHLQAVTVLPLLRKYMHCANVSIFFFCKFV